MTETEEAEKKSRQRLDDALKRIEVFDCCTARKEAKKILEKNPKLRGEYNSWVRDYDLN